ncbi:MAG: haloacid dehalogenase-like hydrolase [Planctomycetota bacterium]|nr:haloacid dehalogenase-like hydrolase [Planctomycetota bacterium]
MSEKKTAAFFRVEGTLIKRGALSVSAYFATNAQKFSDRLFRLGAMAVAAPVYSILGQSDRGLANRMAYFSCRHLSEDRIFVLAEEYYDTMLKDSVLDRGLELMKRARKEGHRIVLISETISEVLEHLKDDLGSYDELVCNRLEYRNGKATGKLVDPVMGGHECGRWIKEYASKEGIDLANSVAYAAHGGDLLLLASVGHPCATNPDFALRRAAREVDWPVVEYCA